MPAPPDTPKALGADILFELLEHLSPAGLLTIGQTCKALHRGSIKPLLRQGVTVVSFQRHQPLRSFCTFILADVSTRAPLVRSLRLITNPSGTGSTEDTSISPDIPLPEVLKHMTALETLRIDDIEATLEGIPGLDTAFSRLTTPRTLHICGMGDTSYHAWDQSEFRLTNLEVNFGVDDGHMDVLEDPIYFATAHRATLEKLRCWWCEVSDDDDRKLVVFPRMRALALHLFGNLDFPVLRQAFPNLRYLELRDGVGQGNEDISERLREYNHDNHKGATGSWHLLEHLRGQLDALYSLALPRCALKHVDVDHFGSSPRHLQRLHTLISDTSPSRLMVRTGCYDNGKAFFDTGKVSALLDVPAAASITHFVLDMFVDYLRGTENELLDGIETSLSSHSSIAFFILRLDKCYSSEEGRKSSDEGSNSSDEGSNASSLDSPKHPSWDVFDQKSQGGIARRLASASPGLRHLCLSTMDSPPRYWSVAHVAGEQAVLTELKPMVGRELVREAGLVFHDLTWGDGIPDDI